MPFSSPQFTGVESTPVKLSCSSSSLRPPKINTFPAKQNRAE